MASGAHRANEVSARCADCRPFPTRSATTVVPKSPLTERKRFLLGDSACVVYVSEGPEALVRTGPVTSDTLRESPCIGAKLPLPDTEEEEERPRTGSFFPLRTGTDVRDSAIFQVAGVHTQQVSHGLLRVHFAHTRHLWWLSHGPFVWPQDPVLRIALDIAGFFGIIATVPNMQFIYNNNLYNKINNFYQGYRLFSNENKQFTTPS